MASSTFDFFQKGLSFIGASVQGRREAQREGSRSGSVLTGFAIVPQKPCLRPFLPAIRPLRSMGLPTTVHTARGRARNPKAAICDAWCAAVRRRALDDGDNGCERQRPQRHWQISELQEASTCSFPWQYHVWYKLVSVWLTTVLLAVKLLTVLQLTGTCSPCM